jgi:hypothetical protein
MRMETGILAVCAACAVMMAQAGSAAAAVEVGPPYPRKGASDAEI